MANIPDERVWIQFSDLFATPYYKDYIKHLRIPLLDQMLSHNHGYDSMHPFVLDMTHSTFLLYEKFRVKQEAKTLNDLETLWVATICGNSELVFNVLASADYLMHAEFKRFIELLLTMKRSTSASVNPEEEKQSVDDETVEDAVVWLKFSDMCATPYLKTHIHILQIPRLERIIATNQGYNSLHPAVLDITHSKFLLFEEFGFSRAVDTLEVLGTKWLQALRWDSESVLDTIAAADYMFYTEFTKFFLRLETIRGNTLHG